MINSIRFNTTNITSKIHSTPLNIIEPSDINTLESIKSTYTEDLKIPRSGSSTSSILLFEDTLDNDLKDIDLPDNIKRELKSLFDIQTINDNSIAKRNLLELSKKLSKDPDTLETILATIKASSSISNNISHILSQKESLDIISDTSKEFLKVIKNLGIPVSKVTKVLGKNLVKAIPILGGSS